MNRRTVAADAMLPVGYVLNASRIADRRMILAGYRVADLLTQVVENQLEGWSFLASRFMPK